jgi:D-glycero-D-manno-heptose 1,7-bisphosphate phosphatase
VDHGETLIVLDRDGVLNRTVPNPAEPRPDSPLRVAEVALLPGVAEALRALTAAGYVLAVASNQPAAAKGKTTRAALDEVHAAVLAAAQAAGGVIASSHVCFHRAEDGCACRKPGTGLLAEAFARHGRARPGASWIVGDRETDVRAGAAFGLRTALVGASAEAERAALAARGIRPSFCGGDLRDFVDYLLRRLDPSIDPLRRPIA